MAHTSPVGCEHIAFSGDFLWQPRSTGNKPQSAQHQMCRHQETHEKPDAWRQRMAGRKGGEQLNAVAPVGGETLDETSGFQVIGHVLQPRAPAFERPPLPLER
jgi:hypothetical protein